MAIDRVKVKKEADKLLTAGKVERAIDEFQKLVDDNPKDYNTLNQIGDLCVQIGRVKEGVEIHKRLGGSYERDGFHARAAAIFQIASVCTSTPSTALTTNTARSTTRRAAATSPTKSA